MAHALIVGDGARAGALATDFGRLQARLGELPAEADGVVADAEAAWRAHADEAGSVEVWATFLREQRHLLRRGRPGWPSSRILLQLAVEHADDSPVTRAAEAWLAEGGCDWTWLRRAPGQRPARVHPSALVAVLDGHMGGVRGVLRLPDGRFLSWSDDGTLAIWDAARAQRVGFHFSANAALLADGRIVTWGLCDEVVRVWDADAGELLFTIGHETSVVWVEVLADGRLLVYTPQELCAWDLDGDDEQPVVFEGVPGIQLDGGRLLADGRLLTWGSGGTIRDETAAIQLWDAACGMCLLTIRRYARGVEELDDGRLVSWDAQGTLDLWDASAGVLLATLEGHDDGVNGLQVLGDGRLLSWSDDATLRLWDARRHRCIAVMRGHRGPVTGILRLADERCLSWSKDGSLRVWSLDDGATVACLRGHAGPVDGAVQLEDGRLVSWGDDLTLRVWDLQRAEAVGVLEGHTQGVSAVIQVDVHRIMSASWDGTLRMWDTRRAADPRERMGHTHYISGTAVLPGARVASWSAGAESSEDKYRVADTSVRLWDGNGRCYAELTRPTWRDARGRLHRPTEGLRGLVGLPPAPVSPTYLQQEDAPVGWPGDRVLGWTEGSAILWDLASGAFLDFFPWDARVAEVHVLADGRFLTYGHSGVCSIWQETPQTQLEAHSEEAWRARVLPLFPDMTSGVTVVPVSDRGVLLWSREYPPVVWDLACGARTLDVGVIQGVLLWPCDGRDRPGADLSGARVVAWRQDDARLWVADADTGACLAVLEGHSGRVRGAALLPDGRLLSWSQDSTLRVWDVRSLAPLGVLMQFEGELDEVMVLADGRILTWSDDEEGDAFVCAWDGVSGERLARVNARDVEEMEADPWLAMFPARQRDASANTGLASLERDYTIARAPVACRRGDIASGVRMGVVRLLGFNDGTVPWHTTGDWVVEHLLDDGRVVARANAELAILQLHHGARRVTLEEARALQRDVSGEGLGEGARG